MTRDVLDNLHEPFSRSSSLSINDHATANLWRVACYKACYAACYVLHVTCDMNVQFRLPQGHDQTTCTTSLHHTFQHRPKEVSMTMMMMMTTIIIIIITIITMMMMKTIIGITTTPTCTKPCAFLTGVTHSIKPKPKPQNLNTNPKHLELIGFSLRQGESVCAPEASLGFAVCGLWFVVLGFGRWQHQESCNRRWPTRLWHPPCT